MKLTQKNFNKVLAVSAIGFGAYAILKGISNDSTNKENGEGSLGGSDDMLGEGDYFDGSFDDNVGLQSIADPNTIPEQYINPSIDTDPNTDSNLPPKSSEPNVSGTSPSSPTSNDFFGAINPSASAPVDIAPTGFFGDLSTPAVIGLGAASFLPSAATSLGKLSASQVDDGLFSIFKKSLPDAVEETPYFGKQLKEFAFKQSDDVATDLTQYGIKKIGGEVAESVVEKGATSFLKTGLKKAGKLGVKSIPFVGIGAGMTLDIASNEEYKEMYDKGGFSRWSILGVSALANALGDVVGGAAAVFTAPAAVTGIGAAVPVVASVGGQIATESAVYSVFNNIRNKNNAGATTPKIINTVINPKVETTPAGSSSSSSSSSNYYKVQTPKQSIAIAPTSSSSRSSSSSSSSRSSSSSSSSKSSSSSNKNINTGKSSKNYYTYTPPKVSKAPTPSKSSSKSNKNINTGKSSKNYYTYSKPKVSSWKY